MQQDVFIHKKSDPALPKLIWGVLLVVIISFISKGLGTLFPLVGNLLFAILIGVILQNAFPLSSKINPGIQFTLKKILKISIVLLGVSLSLFDILEIGQRALWIISLSVSIGIGVTYLVGKMLNIDKRLSLLIGIGTSICGATAISAVKGIVGAKENETAYALSTIVFFNLIAFVTYPLVGQVLQMSDLSFGIWAGTAVHDTSSAVAVGYVYGDKAGEVATTVKLARTLFLIPIMFCLPFFVKTNSKDSRKTNYKDVFPWFIFLFLGVSLLHTFEIIPTVLETYMKTSSKFMIVMVMAAVGLQVRVKDIGKLGFKPLLTGFISSLTCAVISLLLLM
ncbi:YeiH family protein [Rossellomorea aquimaris]|uniref:YeiH family protein n=1 Tax=Rossellomorea aquimaris TaxID=189382 RepID=UPI0009EEAC49|nr:YeiH family protein [Rossellomorea aquimaris]